MKKEEIIPQSVSQAFDISQGDQPAQKVGGGMINRTYKIVDTTGVTWIFQSLNHIIEPKVILSAIPVLNHLKQKGWNCPMYRQALDGRVYVQEGEYTWRVMNYIDHVPLDFDRIPDDLFVNMGKLLAQMQNDLSELDYIPPHKIEGYHERRYYLAKTAEIDWSRESAEVQDIVEKSVAFIEKNGAIFDTKEQLIHSDARIDNTFFDKDKKPFLFFDYDTFMKGSIYIDLGQCIRSLILIAPKVDTKKVVEEFVEGFNAVSKNTITYGEAVLAVELLAVELTLRYVNDTVEDFYFDWDPERFASRKEHNTMRTHRQWKSYQKMKQELTQN